MMWTLLRQAATQWSEHNAPRLGAALAYYTILSLAPLLVVLVAVCGLAFGQEAVRGQLFWQIKDVVGAPSAALVQSLLADANKPAAGLTASLISFIVLLAGASGVFLELRDTLNYIWGAPVPKSTNLWTMLRYRLFSFAIVLGLGFLLVVSLAMSAVIAALGSLAAHDMGIGASILEGINFVVTLVVTALLFGLIYKIIPEVPIDWADVAIGSTVTAVLFTVGKSLIGFYLGSAGVGSSYGAAGSIIILLVWVYYSAQIFLFGAEFTHVYTNYRSSPAIPGAISTAGLSHGAQPAPHP